MEKAMQDLPKPTRTDRAIYFDRAAETREWRKTARTTGPRVILLTWLEDGPVGGRNTGRPNLLKVIDGDGRTTQFVEVSRAENPTDVDVQAAIDQYVGQVWYRSARKTA